MTDPLHQDPVNGLPSDAVTPHRTPAAAEQDAPVSEPTEALEETPEQPNGGEHYADALRKLARQQTSPPETVIQSASLETETRTAPVQATDLGEATVEEPIETLDRQPSYTPELVEPEISTVQPQPPVTELAAPLATRMASVEAQPTDDQVEQASLSQRQSKAAVFALLITMLPILIAGTTTYVSGQRVIDEQATQLKEETLISTAQIEARQRRHLELLAVLSLGTGVTALLVGAIAAFWARRMVSSAMMQAARVTQQTVEKSQHQTAQALAAAVEQLRLSTSEADILEVAVSRLREMLSCDRVLIYGTDDQLDRRAVAESVQLGIPSTLDSVVDPLFIAKYLEPYEQGVRIIPDVYNMGGRTAEQQQLSIYGVRAMMAVPLMVQGERFGFVVAHDCSQPRAWSETERELLQQLTLQTGVALDLVRTAAEREHLQGMVALEAQWRGSFEHTTRLIHDAEAAEEILEAAVIETRRVLACDRVVLYSLNDEEQGVIIAESAAPGCLRTFGRTIDDPCFDAKYIEMYTDGRVRAINDVYAANLSPCYLDQLEALDVKANLVAPVVHESKLMGLLVAHQCSEPRDWKEIEIRWFTQIAVQVGYALDNAKFKQQAEQKAQTTYQEQAGVRETVSQLLSHNQETSTLLTTSTEQLGHLETVVDQLQAIADSTRQMTAKAQTAVQEHQSIAHSLQSSYASVNQAVDVITNIQDTVVDATSKIGNLGTAAQTLTQLIGEINTATEPMSQLAISLSITSGQQDQGAVVDATAAVLAFTQQMSAITAQLQPLVDQMQQDTQSIIQAMEMGSEQAIVGTELTKQTRHHLNQVQAHEETLAALLQKLMEAVPQRHSLTATSQTVQTALTLTHQTLEQSAALSDLVKTLETSMSS